MQPGRPLCDRATGGTSGLDRRRFLGIAGTGLLGSLSDCGPSPAGLANGPSEADWEGLKGQIAGSILRPGDAEYDQARVLYNTRFDTVFPQAIARCSSAGDVAAVLAFVRRFSLAVTPRSGGHSYAGYSSGNGMVIDVGGMRSIQVGEGTATIGAGARLVDVYDQLTAQGVAIPSGSCASIGIAGITQGGGVGIVDRAFGLTCDRLVSAQVVTADGRILLCDAENEPDLFWALRGGGGGNFGVVTSLTFLTHRTSDLTNFYAGFPMESALDVLAAWQAWLKDLPDWVWSGLGMFFSADPPNPFQLSVSGVSISDQETFAPLWSALLGATGVRPTVESVELLSYRATLLSYACGSLSVSECHLPGQTADAALTRQAFTASSDLFDLWLPAKGIGALVEAMTSRYQSGRRGGVLVDSMGGAIGRVPSDATAFVHRSSVLSAQYLAQFPQGTSSDTVAEAVSWTHGMRAVMQPWSSGRAYQNYIDPQIGNWQTAYYGSNYPRLVRVKAAYDPGSVFRFPQGIPPQ